MEKYAGIDIAKRTHWMCVTDAEGRFLMEPRPYDNDADGLSRMVADLDLYGGDVAVGMESTGCYWRSCYKALAEGGYPVSVINPVVTCAERKSGNLGRAKTDRVDCLVVADALRKQGIAPTPSPDADAAQLRDLCRFRRAVSESMSRTKIQAVALLDQVWPEYGKLFSDKFGDSSRSVLRRFASGDMDADGLADDLRGASRNRFGAAKASDVLQSLRSTCGVPATDALRLQLRLLLDQLDFCAAQLAEIDAEADSLLDAVAPTLPTVPGVGRATAAQIAAEVGDVTRFRDAKALVAYAGLADSRAASTPTATASASAAAPTCAARSTSPPRRRSAPTASSAISTTGSEAGATPTATPSAPWRGRCSACAGLLCARARSTTATGTGQGERPPRGPLLSMRARPRERASLPSPCGGC